jgi:FkbM family methyltransferase
MKTIYKIIKYIFKSNSLVRVPFYLIRAFFYQIFKRLTGKIISIKLFNGRQLFLYPDSNVSSMFVYTDIPDKEEVDLLRSFTTDNSIFLDIGANIGSYSVLLMDKVKDIYAFEPHPLTARQCKMNFLLNGYEENRVVQLALSDVAGEVYFTDNKKQTSINRISDISDGSIKVSSNTLDNFARQYLKKEFDYIVKIDTEGFEENVLKGGSDFFRNYNVKCVAFECFLGDDSNVFRLLNGYGYEIVKIDDYNFYARKI